MYYSYYSTKSCPILKMYLLRKNSFLYVFLIVQQLFENSNTHPTLVFTMVPGVGANSSEAYKRAVGL
jgi:hypothetical protein